MKNSTLLFRSVLIVAIIAGIPHALAIYASDQHPTNIEAAPDPETQEIQTASSAEDYWPGRYEVSFEGMQEKSVYEIRKEGNVFQVHAIKYIDDTGNAYDDDRLVMEKLNINEYTAKAKYQIEYEGEKYEVNSLLVMDEQGDISLSYSYYGESARETWKRLQ